MKNSACIEAISAISNDNIVMHYPAKGRITVCLTSLDPIHKDGKIIDYQLSLFLNLETYQRMDTKALFNLKPETRELFLAEKFQCRDDIKIELSLKPDLLDSLVEHSNNAEEAASYLIDLSQNQPNHPLLFTENWLALSVKQQLESGEIGYNTLWNYINPSAFAPGAIDSEEVVAAVANFFANWTESYLTENLQKSTSEILDGITNFFQEFVDESLNKMPRQNQRKSARIQNIDEPESSLTEPIPSEEAAASDRVLTPPLVDDEIEAISSSRILQELIDFFEKDEWSFNKIAHDSIIQTSFQGDNGQCSCYARAREIEQQAVFYSIFPVNAPEPKRLAIAEFITRANYGTIIDNFELDFEDGEIRYKTSIDVEDDRLSFALIENLVYANVSMMDKYLPGLMSVIYSDVTPKHAIDIIEG